MECCLLCNYKEEWKGLSIVTRVTFGTRYIGKSREVHRGHFTDTNRVTNDSSACTSIAMTLIHTQKVDENETGLLEVSLI